MTSGELRVGASSVSRRLELLKARIMPMTREGQHEGGERGSKLAERTKAVALLAVRCAQGLPRTDVGRVLGRQLLRAGTSVGANYRAACRAKSRRDMIAKLKIVEEEADEVLYWLELLRDAEVAGSRRVRSDLQAETHHVLRMTVASIKTLRQRPD